MLSLEPIQVESIQAKMDMLEKSRSVPHMLTEGI